METIIIEINDEEAHILIHTPIMVKGKKQSDDYWDRMFENDRIIEESKQQ